MTKTTAGLLALAGLVVAALARPQAAPSEALDPQVRAELHRRLDTAVNGHPAPAVPPPPAELAPGPPGERVSSNRR